MGKSVAPEGAPVPTPARRRKLSVSQCVKRYDSLQYIVLPAFQIIVFIRFT